MRKTDADIAHIAAACAKQLRKDEKRARDFSRSAKGQQLAYLRLMEFPCRVRPGRVR